MKKILLISGLAVIAAICVFMVVKEEPRNLTSSTNNESMEELPAISDRNQLIALLQERAANRSLASGNTASAELSTTNQQASSTNVQVQGIDEGDRIKTNGKHIFFARNTDIVIASADEKESNVKSLINEKKFRPTELFLEEDILIAIGTSYSKPVSSPTDSPAPRAELAIMPTGLTTVYFYDISTIENPKKLREISFDGSLSASRKSNSHVYLIANSYPPVHILNKEQNKNEELRPTVKDTAVGKSFKSVEYKDMYYLPDSYENSFLLTASIDLKQMSEPAKVEAFLGATNHLYMSEKHMYLAVNKLEKPTQQAKDNSSTIMPRPVGDIDTQIFQFDLQDGSISFNASTEVNGRMLNQFSMDEYQDTFRVATTSGNPGQKEPTTNNVYTFDQSMKSLGKIENLAEGEQIYSIRFMNEIAYMVTFKQVDPLFVIDLKNPKIPEVLGKLKIPGFSNYLHPLNEDYLIGFGQETEIVKSKLSNEPQVQVNGLKISLFDVSNLSHPVEIDNEIIGDAGSYSEVTHNHHALYKHPSANLFGFPATLYDSKTLQQGDVVMRDQSFSYEGAFLYTITPETGIELKDSITHQDVNVKQPDWESEVKRMVSAEDYLYTFSLNQMSVYNIKTEEVVETIELPTIKDLHD
ncbi:beta-propeller domain-containing protein [Virgibacillus flavescens]|uniref:beta-propeller domain-containing protein n=1 Tax=Virgibacillus flavescens TaxID=1611422 RepID=UPI003D34DCF1